MNCKQATQLMSEKLDRPLRIKEKISLAVHKIMCIGCRRFSLQMDKLRTVSKRYTKSKK